MDTDIQAYEGYVSALEAGELEHAGAAVERRGWIESEDDSVADIDRRLIRVAGKLAEVRDPDADRRGEPEWWHNLWLIIDGKYPLDQLPKHVRDLAEKLYYD